MGITKKAVLASLVCLMMSLAFLIGLMPSREAVDVTAASRSNGRVDMVDLLNAVLNLKSAPEATEIAVSEPPDGALFVVPTDAPRGLINAASVTVPDGEDADDVLLGVDGVFDPINHTWTGDTHSDLLGFGNYSRGFVNIAGLTAEAHKMYALGFATADPLDTARYIYGGTPDPLWSGENSTEFMVDVASASRDSDDNGLPDSIGYFVSDLSVAGLQWVSSDAAASRTVTVANLDVASGPKSNGMVAVCPTPGVFVYCPSLTALKAAGVLYGDTWAAWIVAWGAESPDLDKMIDSPDPATWANNLEQKAELHSSKTPPSYLGLALAYFRLSTGMEMPFVTGPLPAEVAIHVVFENVATDIGETVSLWSVPAGLDATDPDNVILVGDSTPDLDWTKKADMIQDPDVPTTYSAELTTFSIMAPFTPPVLSVTPANRGVAADAGDTTFDIAFTSGTPAWMAVVNSIDTWLTIDQVYGAGNATLTASFDPNIDINPRDGQITVTAEDAEGSPVTVTVTQEGMSLGAIAVVLFDNFDSLDTNGDGQLTLDESGLSPEVFDDLDKDGDGFLTRAELRAAGADVSPVIDAIEPNEAWLFGGVKAKITGQNFYPDTEVTVAGQAVEPIAITDTEIYLIIPALEDISPEDAAVLTKSVRVTNPVAKSYAEVEFTFKRFETKVYPDGDLAVSMTAFIRDSAMSTVATALALYTDNSGTTEPSYAYLTLPLPPSTPDPILKVYGLARATSNAVMKATNIYSDLLIQVDPPYQPIPNVWDFAIHLYNPEYNTGPIWNTSNPGSRVYDEFSDFAYNTPAAELQFPVANTCETLAAVNIAASLYMYSAETRYDYATDTTSFSTPALPPSVGQYQLTPDDFIIFDSVATRDTVVTKLYDFGGVFSLRYTPSAPSVTPDNRDVGAAAGSTTFDIAIASFAPPNTSNWTATPEYAWLTLPQPSGTGDTALTVNVGANSGPARIGHITVAFDCAEVAPQVVAVTQEAGAFMLTTSVVGGHGTLDPLTGLQPANAVVPLTAAPAAGYRVKTWTGTDNDASTADTNTVTMTSDKTVRVEFELITFMLTTEVVGGNGTLLPASGLQLANAVVPLTAAPVAGYRVKTWTGTDNDASIANTNTVTMTSDKTVTVEFELITGTLQVAIEPAAAVLAGAMWQVDGGTPQYSGVVVTLPVGSHTVSFTVIAGWTAPVDQPVTITVDTLTTVAGTYDLTPIVTSLTPTRAWVFGGVVAQIDGSNFAPDAVVTFGATVAEKVTRADSGSDRIYVIVPPVAEFAGASQTVSVKVTNGAATTNAPDFMYLHYEKTGDVVTTAFTVTDTDPTKPIALDIVKSLVTDEASLTLPLADANLGTMSSAYVLVRATLKAARVGTDIYVNENDNLTHRLTNAWDFSIHVYDPTAEDSTVAVNRAVYGEVHPTFTRGVTTGAQLTMPVSLTATDNIVSVWAVETPDYDYGQHPADEDATSGVSPKAQYIVPITEITEPPTGTVTVHLYDFSSFTLRKNSGGIIPLVLTPDNGPNCGGTLVKITCDAGGLGSAVKGVTFGTSKATIQLPVVNEYEIEVKTPGVAPFAGRVGVKVYFGGTAGALAEPSVTKPEAFAYYGSDGFWPGVLIALGALLLGYTQGYTAPGGGGGGGGGGGCFIATAAYGTPMAADIDTLRAFRDTYLLSSSGGTAFVDAYYRVSPFIANVVAQSPFLAAVVRLLLAPVIFGLKTPLTMMVLLSIGAMMVAVRKHLRRKA